MRKLGPARTACILLLVGVAAMASAQTFETLVNFSKSSGQYPVYSPLIQGTDGNFYGTSEGSNNNYGMVYQVTSKGAVTPLYSFCAQKGCTDGRFPTGGVIQGSNGNFYGVTGGGGAKDAGVIYEVTPAGVETVLYSFCPLTGCPDGSLPIAGLVEGSDGNFYGTTHRGGANGDYGNYGTIFKITPSRQYTVLYSFCSQANCADGESPAAPLIQASNGNFYGTTEYGGVSPYCADQSLGCGTLFEITPEGKFTTLYTFCSQANCTDGFYPYNLVQASNGNIYGIAYIGGANGDGAIFQLSPSGNVSTLYSFCSQSSCSDGESPDGPLVQGTNGSLFGTTLAGGGVLGFGNGFGTVFAITPTGKLTTLHSFRSLEGMYPAGVLQASDGTLYGVTEEGGANQDGTLFSLMQ